MYYLSYISYAFFNILIDNKLIKLMQKLLSCLLVLKLSICILFSDLELRCYHGVSFFSDTYLSGFVLECDCEVKAGVDRLSPMFLLVDPVGISPEMVVALGFSPWIFKHHQIQLQHDYHISAPMRQSHTSDQSFCCMRPHSWLLASKYI